MDEIKMKPGRYLDAVVAEKVMGWTFDGEIWHTSRERGVMGHAIPLPHYSTDIAAAWEVVDHFKSKKEVVEIEFSFKGGRWDCVISIHDARLITGYGPMGGACETAPHAICLAALQAVGA